MSDDKDKPPTKKAPTSEGTRSDNQPHAERVSGSDVLGGHDPHAALRRQTRSPFRGRISDVAKSADQQSSPAMPKVTLSSNSDVAPSETPAPSSLQTTVKALAERLGPAELAKAAELAQGKPSPEIEKSMEGALSGIGNGQRNSREGDLRNDRNQASEQSNQPAEKPAVPASQSANPMHPGDRLFYVVIAWLAIPVALTAGAIIGWLGNQLAGSLALSLVIIGLLGMVIGTSYALENRALPSRSPSSTILGIAALTWLLIGWQTWLFFQKPVEGYTKAQLDEAISKAKAPLQSELTEATKQRDASINEVESVRRDLANAQQQLDAARKLGSASSQPIDPNTTGPTNQNIGPINWNINNQLIVASGSGPTARVNGFVFQGQSSMPVRFKDAYVISGLTGHTAQLKAAVHSVGKELSVTEVDVPTGASVQLDLIFDPALSVSDFLDQWGKFRLFISYENGRSFEHDFDETIVHERVQSMLPNTLGPRVTPRQMSK